MDRLIALVTLRWRLDLRGLRWAPERAVALLLTTPLVLGASLFAAFFAFLAVRALSRAQPDLVLPLGSLMATVIGVFWMLTPLLTGMSLAETEDPTRLLQFPIPLPTLAGAALMSNLFRLGTLSRLPVVLALAAGTAQALYILPLTVVGVLLSFVFILTAAQAAGLLFHALARSRRARDVALFLGLGLGVLMTLFPLLLVAGLVRSLPALLDRLLTRDLFALSPFAWGFRAAVHAGRGEIGPFLAYGLGSAVATAVVVGAFAWELQRLYRGEVDLGVGRGGAGHRARMMLPGRMGALFEKDLRVTWRDPTLKIGLLMSLVMPLLLLFFLMPTRGSRSGTGLLILAVLLGPTVSTNAFGIEGRAIGLLVGFPVPRWRILAAKNLALLLFRLPGLLAVVVAGLVLGPISYLPAALTVTVVALLVSAGADNYVSILFPTPIPPPGRGVPVDPRGRGPGRTFFRLLAFFSPFVLGGPFMFLAAFPAWYGQPALWLIALPLAVAGAAATYAMLLAGAARLLEKREPELLERMLVPILG